MTLGELRQLNNLPAVETDVDYKPGSPWDVMSNTLKIWVLLNYRPHFPSFYSAWAAGVTENKWSYEEGCGSLADPDILFGRHGD